MQLIINIFFLITLTSCIYAKMARSSVDTVYATPTVGRPWPLPQSIQTTAQQFALHSAAFHFFVDPTSQTCDLLTSALDRYFRLIFYPKTYLSYILDQQSTEQDTKQTPKKSLADLADVPQLTRLVVRIDHACDQYPSLESNESCK